MKSRIKRTSVAAVLLVLIALAGVSSASASPLRVIGSSSSSGEFAVTAANAHKDGAHAIYLRAYGHDLSGMGVVACSRGLTSIGSKSTTLSSMKSGRLYKLKLPFAGDCDVTASLSGAGSIRLQVLA